MSDGDLTLGRITEIVRRFVRERDWERFHRPSALAMSAAIEMGELLANFQWLTDDDVARLSDSEEFRGAVADEMADVIIYLVRLADALDIDLSDAIVSKMERNAIKYPADKWRGRAPLRF